jgi:KaiC/GvpD/RAD55 family RecA-like ATPase/DNA-binding response OmpR family regulator
MEAISTGFDLFDAGPARCYRGKPYLVFGASGTGKSILGLQFACAGLDRGEKVLYVCREKAYDLVQRGEELGFALGEHLDDDRLVLLEYDDAFQDIVKRQGADQVLEELCGEIDPAEISRVVLDPIDPFFSSLENESLLRSQLRTITGRFEDLGWTPLLLCDVGVIARDPFVLRVFSELCWGVFELRCEPTGDDVGRSLRIYHMRNVNLGRSKFELRIGEGGIRAAAPEPQRPRRSFARFRRAPSTPAEGEAAACAAATPADELERRGAAAARALALVADEDPEVRARVAAALESVGRSLGIGMRIAEAADGMQALRSAAAAKPDLVITSVGMARLDGIGLCRLLREHGVDVPLLFLSSRRAAPGERVRCFLVGGDETVGRPVDPEEIAGKVAALLQDRAPGTTRWPTIDLKTAHVKLGPSRVDADQLEEYVAIAAERAREAGVALHLVGYEFRFVDSNEGRTFIDRFFEGLSEQIRAEDALCPLPDHRIVVMLVDADTEIVRSVIGRIHERMVSEAASLAGGRRVKPKALYRLLPVCPPAPGAQIEEGRIVATLFAQPARLIEEDLAGRPGEPVEKYPLLEAVYTVLVRGDARFVSPRDGSSHEVMVDAASGSRSVVIGDHRYRSQDPTEESPAGYRASRGAWIVWVEDCAVAAPPMARIEDGRVFRSPDR